MSPNLNENEKERGNLSAMDLLNQLRSDMEASSNKQNQEPVTEAPKTPAASGKKYRFRTESRKKYDEKQRLARMADEISDLLTDDMDDAQVEETIRRYLADEKAKADKPAEQPAPGPAPVPQIPDVAAFGGDVFDGETTVVANPIPETDGAEASVYLEEEVAEYPDMILELAHDQEQIDREAAAVQAAEEERLKFEELAREQARLAEEKEQKQAARERAEQEIGFDDLAAEQEEEGDRSYDEFVRFLEEKGAEGGESAAWNELFGIQPQDVPAQDADTVIQDAVAADDSETSPADGVAAMLGEDTAEFDKTDVDLMTAFGLDDEFRNTMDQQQADLLQAELDARGDDSYVSMLARTREKPARNQRSEYVSPSQNKEIFAEYKEKYSGAMLKLIAGFVLLLFSFFYENVSVFGGKLPQILSPDAYQSVHVLIDFQIVLLAVGLVFPNMWSDFLSSFKKQPGPGTVTAVAFLACVCHTALTLILAPARTIRLYYFPVVFTAFIQQICDTMTLKREIMSFKIASSKKIKYCIEPLEYKDAKQELDAFAEYLPDAPEMYKVHRSAFIDGFFDRSDAYPRHRKVLRFVLPLTVLCALAFIGANYIMTYDLYGSLTVGFVTCMMILPASAALAFCFPIYRASKKTFEQGSAIIGECSPAEYSNATVISFTDRDVFPASGVKVRSVKVYGENRIDHIVYNAASIFAKLGGPLADVFRVATAEIGRSEDIEIRRIDDDGVEAVVNGKIVIIGKADYMARYGYRINLPEQEAEMEASYDTNILFMAYETEMAAKMYIQYAVDGDFEHILKELYRQGMCVAIKTNDPNINDGMISAKINLSKYPVKVLRQDGSVPTDSEGNVNLAADRASSGVISKNSAKSALQALAMCDRVLRCFRRNTTLKLISVFLAMVLMAAQIFFSFTAEIPSVLIVLYQLIFMIPMFFGTVFTVR